MFVHQVPPCVIGWPWSREAKKECGRLQAALDKKRSKLKAKGKDKKELKRSLEVCRPPTRGQKRAPTAAAALRVRTSRHAHGLTQEAIT